MALASRAQDAGRLLLDLVTRDPAFVRGGGLRDNEIPVFTFHSLEPRAFERKMRFLRDGGYEALSMSRYLDAITGRQPAPAKSVLVTIDDGRATTWTVGYPILKQLGLRATAFLVTSAVHDSDEVSRTIADVGRDQWGPLVSRDDSPNRPFVTWGEVGAMRDVIDIESHTHLHARIAVGPDQASVMTPAMRFGYGAFDCPFQWLDASGQAARGSGIEPGTPLPASAPRLSGRPAYRGFERRYETAIEVAEAMRLDLAEARRLIRERAGVDATTVCYPWHVFSDQAKATARESGYVAGFAGKAHTGPPISGPGCDLFEIARVGEDYVERLPGPGRRSLFSILREKLLRRAS